MLSSVVEVAAVCGFVFGVACKLPPSLTILLLNGVFWFVIGWHLVWKVYNRNITEDDTDKYTKGKCFLCLKFKLVPLLEFVAFLMQLSVLIVIPILLAYTESIYKKSNDKHLAIYILIPVTLTCISMVWSGWLHKYFVEPKIKETVKDARLKSGMYIRKYIFMYVSNNIAICMTKVATTFHFWKIKLRLLASYCMHKCGFSQSIAFNYLSLFWHNWQVSSFCGCKVGSAW